MLNKDNINNMQSHQPSLTPINESEEPVWPGSSEEERCTLVMKTYPTMQYVKSELSVKLVGASYQIVQLGIGRKNGFL